MAKFAQFQAILNLFLSLDDLTYAQEMLNFFKIEGIMADVACKLNRQLQMKKNKKQGINPKVLENRPKELR